jgi:cytochrome c peroxidase
VRNSLLPMRQAAAYSLDAVNHPPRAGAPRQKRLYRPLLAIPLLVAGCGKLADDIVCSDPGCDFSREEWKQVRALTDLGEPPPDPSNKYLPRSAFDMPGDPGQAARELAVLKLGQRYYFETLFSGNANWKDVLGRDTTSGRAARGEPIKISCATCHDPSRAGSDFTSLPGHVSVGAGWYDVNGQQTANAAQYRLLYWNGRSDSLWSQAAAVMESGVSMNGTRLAIVWTVAEKYGADHQAIFTDAPLPMTGTTADVKALLAKDMAGKDLFSCAGTAPDACPAGCRAVKNDATGMDACMPRFPLAGKPGSKPGCQAGDAAEPFADAYDCMATEDKQAIDRAYSNVAKAIAAYEWKLTSRDSAFDRFVHDPKAAPLPAAAQRGLKLFVGRASCIDCHNSPLFSDNAFHNIGVPQQGESVPTEGDCTKGNARCDCVTEGSSTCMPWGASFGLASLRDKKAFRRDGAYSDDPAAGAATYGALYAPTTELLQQDRGAWRTPSLRDVALTAPYMHDGFYRTLEDVLWHYDQGGSFTGIGKKAFELRPLHLSTAERADLVEFLKTLTGAPARTDFVTAAQP